MVRMKDPNIVRLLAACTVDEPFCVIVEYMKYGDLTQYLNQHVLEGSATCSRRANKAVLRLVDFRVLGSRECP